MRTSLYRHFDIDGALLYVGMSLNHVARLRQHSSKSWFFEVVRVDVEHFATRELADAAETRAIQTEKPRYNKAKTKVKKMPVGGYHGMSAAEIHEDTLLLRRILDGIGA